MLARLESQVTTREPPAPITILSSAQTRALIACHFAGMLTRQRGKWIGRSTDCPIAGVTVADLARDGFMILWKGKRMGNARLTQRGKWFARTLTGGK